MGCACELHFNFVHHIKFGRRVSFIHLSCYCYSLVVLITTQGKRRNKLKVIMICLMLSSYLRIELPLGSSMHASSLQAYTRALILFVSLLNFLRYIYPVLPPVQIIRCFDFSRYDVFATYLDIYSVYLSM